MYETIRYESIDKVLTITLNRPDRLNAFTPQMRDELLDAIERADEDDGIRAIVFTGAGAATVPARILAVVEVRLVTITIAIAMAMAMATRAIEPPIGLLGATVAEH